MTGARAPLLVSIAVVVAGVAMTSDPVRAQDDATSAVESIDPVNVNEASLSDLLEIPGMDPDLARAIRKFRLEEGPLDSLSTLYRSPEITPARLLPVLPWLVAEGKRDHFVLDLTTSVRSTSLPVSRKDVKLGSGRGAVYAALRYRAGLPPEEDETSRNATGGVLRLNVAHRVTVHLGDVAPVEGFGLLLGLSGSPPTRGALAIPSSSAWFAHENDDLRRAAPAPDGRLLRGGALAFGTSIVAGAFTHQAGSAGTTGDFPSNAARRVLLLGLGLGEREKASRAIAARAVFYDGRPWLGLQARAPLSGGRVAFEIVRDPERRTRFAIAAEGAERRRFRFRFSQTGGSRGFVNPLGRDSDHAPAAADLLDTGSNENRSESALLCRVQAVRRMAFEVEVRGAVDPATSRRDWDRPVGSGIARLEASPGGGWSLAAEARVETRGSPGPSAEADAPVRRHAAKLSAGWARGGSHLRLEWQGRFDIEVPPGGVASAPLADVQDLVAVRARVSLAPWLWAGGGAASYRMPPAAPGVLYEERPAGLAPGVFVRGAEERVHAALGIRKGGLEGGGFLARRRAPGGAGETSWGAVVHLRAG